MLKDLTDDADVTKRKLIGHDIQASEVDALIADCSLKMLNKIRSHIQSNVAAAVVQQASTNGKIPAAEIHNSGALQCKEIGANDINIWLNNRICCGACAGIESRAAPPPFPLFV